MIIGLGYKARSGKDTAAEYLCQHHHFTRGAFADSVKRACMEIFQLPRDRFYGDNKEEIDPFWKDSPRNMLQKVGTECMQRGYSKDVWVRSLERTILNGGGLKKDWVVTDVRFYHEASAIIEWGGLLVKVSRPDAPRIVTSQHSSETEMDKWDRWDYQLDNSGDLPQLYANIELMMQRLRT